MTSVGAIGERRASGFWSDVSDSASDVSEAWRPPATVRIALAGCGVVGSALLRELTARRATLRDRHGVRVVLSRVLVRDVELERAAPFDRTLLTASVDEFLDAEADVIVEAIGGLDPARRIAISALSRGRALVTANKELLAVHGSELASVASRCRTTLRYDAAVGGGVPVLRLLDDALGAGTPTRVRGILNGTSNFVLTKLEEGASLDDALRAARHAGFAEADATRDLDGRDAAAKLALVAWGAFGVAPESVRVRRTSLLPDPARYVRLGERFERSVRQIAECALMDGAVIASVEPVLVERGSAFARTRDEQNRVEVHTGWSAPLCASGPGAGGVPTATALLSDLLATSRPACRATHPGATPRVTRGGVEGRDPRRSRWALDVRGAPALLHRLVPCSGFVHTDAVARSAWSIIDSATVAEIADVVRALDAAGADPIVVRFDDDAEADRGRGGS
ncbi:MAG TPA: homoserine dehydrogenase [Gemmatimonadaceae bacterium]|nr:homoserine dehydrogenase [Gemmatimonadaceae bacterium]